MAGLLITLLIVYVLVGVIIYAVTDTTGLASRIEAMLVVFPFGIIENYFFIFVVVFWPVWLFLGNKNNI